MLKRDFCKKGNDTDAEAQDEAVFKGFGPLPTSERKKVPFTKVFAVARPMKPVQLPSPLSRKRRRSPSVFEVPSAYVTCLFGSLLVAAAPAEAVSQTG